MRAVGLQREEDTKWVTDQPEQLRSWRWKGPIEPAQELLQRWQQEGRGHQSAYETARYELAATQCHLCRRMAGRMAQRGLDAPRQCPYVPMSYLLIDPAFWAEPDANRPIFII
ncbi:hypothetical protein KDK_58440 [Dictyobacter kobayashii]|uniref:Uncharacterized protein n=1 Tax=Dictyobacter kobayashii TaxID=2014872 RepID=A0A402ASH0_9CHLR|nr:hypothetical protein KDK_58440 [Dictyobacter kobayashii]